MLSTFMKTVLQERWVLFGLLIVIVPLWLYRSRFYILNCFHQKIEACIETYHDFKRSGRFYNPWKRSTPAILVTSKKHIAEYCEVTCLSQQAAYADIFGFKHTMNNLEHDRIDHKVVRNRLNNRLLEVQGPRNLEYLYPNYLVRFEDSWTKALKEGRSKNGSISLPAAQTCRNLSARMMSLIFFGEKLSSDETFIQELLNYSRDMKRCMVAFQVTPDFISRWIHSAITAGGKAMHTVQSRFIDVLGPGRERWDEEEHIKRRTIIYNMAELTQSSSYWNSPEMNSQNMLGVWFAASHQPWSTLTTLLLELSARKDWQDKLRKEIEDHAQLDDFKSLDKLPFLDSFMKEVVRLNPVDRVGVRRKAVLGYDFSDGSLCVPQGATLGVPAYEMLRDPAKYTDPNDFDGARFVPKDSDDQQVRFTAVSHDFPTWGYGSLACPGRFHVAFVTKIVLSQLLIRYDMSLENENAPRRWFWETFALPSESARIILKERAH